MSCLSMSQFWPLLNWASFLSLPQNSFVLVSKIYLTLIGSFKYENACFLVKDTAPYLMVAAGDTEPDYLNPGHTALSNVELLSSSSNDFCLIPVDDIIGKLITTHDKVYISTSDLAGHTGIQIETVLNLSIIPVEAMRIIFRNNNSNIFD